MKSVNFSNIIKSIFFKFCKEPVGSKAPTLDADTKLSLMVRRLSTDINLHCNAQAYPMAISRYFFSFLIYMLMLYIETENYFI